MESIPKRCLSDSWKIIWGGGNIMENKVHTQKKIINNYIKSTSI